MKEDDDFTFISVCPVSGESLSYDEIMQSNGVCPRCGHDDDSTITHEKKIPGKWTRPSLFEWILGSRKFFTQKE